MNVDPDPSLVREREIFLGALGKTSPVDRAAYLDGACENDAALRARLESLLEHYSNDSFLEEPALGPETRPPPEPVVSEGTGTVIGRFKLLQKLGEGGMGVVYLAEQMEPVRRHVALKIIKLGMDTKSIVARFEAERQALALMEHPNIAKVLDAGATETGRPYFVMELVRGIKITEYTDQNHLSMRERLELFIQVCRAVQHAHQKGIIHRDLKPSNILVTLHDGVAVPKVIDFGIAKATEGRLTELTVYTGLHQFVGTPAYMSPEQAEMSGLDIDTRSDIYSLGVLLYELLTGQTPFDAKELVAVGLDEMRRTIRERDPARPSIRLGTMLAGELTATAKRRACEVPKMISALRGDLDWIVMKALEKDRARRYETANGLAMDIQRHLANEPVAARPLGAAYRFQKVVRRNKLAFAAAGTVAGVLVLGVVISTWQAVRAVRAQQSERRQRLAADNLRTIANTEAARANEQARFAKEKAEESRQRLVQLNVANGTRLVSEGDLSGALLWFAEALKLDEGKPAEEEMHRIRIGAVLRQCPRLVQLWFHPQPVQVVDFSPDGRHIATLSGKVAANEWIPRGTRDVLATVIVGEVQVWDAGTGKPVTPPLPHSGIHRELLRTLFSPNGQRLVTCMSRQTPLGGLETEVHISDANSGELALPPLQYEGMVFHVGFSQDSHRIVIAGARGTQADDLTGVAQVYDALTGQPVGPPLRHDGPIGHAAFDPEGRRVVTASTDRTACIWEVASGRHLVTFRGSNSVVHADFSHDGQRVVTTVSWGDAVRVWDAATGEPVTRVLPHGAFYALFSPNDRRVLSSCFENCDYLWDAATGQLTAKFPHEHSGSVDIVLFNPDGSRVLTATAGSAALIWDAATGNRFGPGLYHAADVLDGKFSPDGHRVVTAGQDRTVRLWDLSPMETNVITLRHEGGDVDASSVFSTDGRRVGTANASGTARVWDPQTGRPLSPALPLKNAAFSPDTRLVIGTGEDGIVRISDAITGTPVNPPLQYNSHDFQHAEFSPDNRRVVTVSARKAKGVPLASYLSLPETPSSNGTPREPALVEFRIWDVTTGKPLSSVLSNGPPLSPHVPEMHARFSSDGRLLVTATSDGVARVWDAANGNPISPPMPHRGVLHDASFSRDGRKVMTDCSGPEDIGVKIWDTKTGALLIGLADGGGHSAFSPDGNYVVTASIDGTARVWNAATGKPVTPPLHHDKTVLEAKFSPNGRLVLTASWDYSARVWDALTGEPVAQFLQHSGNVWTASFSPDGGRVVTTSSDGTAKIWSLAPENRPVADLRLLAQLLSARKIDPRSGGLEPADTVTLSNVWQKLRAEYPDDFGAHD